MTVAYASTDDLANFVGPDSDLPSEADQARMLARASELLDDAILAPFSVDATTSLPTDETVAANLRDAACAQVEFWIDLGEDFDIEGLAGSMSVFSASVQAPRVLAPRAVRLLRASNLLALHNRTAYTDLGLLAIP